MDFRESVVPRRIPAAPRRWGRAVRTYWPSAFPFTLLLPLLFGLSLSLGGSRGVWASPHTKKAKTTPPKPQKSETALQREGKELRSQIRQKAQQRDEAKKRASAVATQIKKGARRLEEKRHSLKATQTLLTRLGERQKAVASEKDTTRRQLDVQRRGLADHLRQEYTRGQPGYAEILFQPPRACDSVSQSLYTARIMDWEAAHVARTQGRYERLEKKGQALEARTEEQRAVRERLQDAVAQERTILDHQSHELVKIQTTIKNIEEDLAEMEMASRAIEAQIRAFQQARRSQGALRAWVGSFIQPVQGIITSQFGVRYHPILLRWLPHTGIDIAAPGGTTIRAAGQGEVIFAGYLGGYGNCVILDHGGEVSTLYAHCSTLLVSKGETVRQGQPIARVGRTGRATGPHLHFEERHNGTPVDPQRHASR